jgi:predicted phosphodiesterase
MRITVLSDLHLEFRRCGFVAPDVDADVVVLAGDIHQGPQGIAWARESYPGRPVVYVAGNHEFYGEDWVQLPLRLNEAAASGTVHFLEDGQVELLGVRFIGATLWTDFELFGQARVQDALVAAEAMLFDFRCIGHDLVATTRSGAAHGSQERSLLRAAETIERHRASVGALQKLLEVPFDGPTVVVSHHAPSPRSVAPRYGADLVSAAFASDLESLIEHYEPDLWIHGHTHDSFDYQLGRTRVVCNPRGYVSSQGNLENSRFDPELIIEIAVRPDALPESRTRSLDR